jgi:hypothetical protein
MATSKKSALSEKNQPQTTIVRPDWGFWDKHTCTLLDGILLSLNICPLQYPVGKNLNATIDQLFWYRQSAALDAMPFVDWVLDKGGAFPYSSGLVTIHLKKFALWVDEETNWQALPLEFIVLKPKSKMLEPLLVNPTKDSRVAKKWTDEELNQLLRESDAGKTNAALAKEHQLDRSRISQLLKKARSLTEPVENSVFGLSRQNW